LIPSSKVKIYFRADGNSHIGLGHVVRCLSIAEMIYRHFSCHFLIKEPGEQVLKMISPFAKVITLSSTLALKEEISVIDQYLTTSDILVTDNYSLDRNYQVEAKKKVKKLVAIDDEARIHFYADIVMNHASSDIASRYSKEAYTQILAGPKYLIAREAFRKAAGNQRTVKKIKSLFICLGGADPFNITCKVLDAAINTPFKHIIVVTGSAYQHYEALSSRCEVGRVEWKSNLTSDEMVNEITKCEIAVSTASSISFEICCVKAGLLTGLVAENQQNIHQCLVDNGCAHSIGDFRNVTKEEITCKLNYLFNLEVVNNQMKQQHLLVDGESGTRILNMFNNLAKGE
jgi:UDP-2,4-diacetamido-2,4,6-trideoxy-beta-L-altropyranose hydrolase